MRISQTCSAVAFAAALGLFAAGPARAQYPGGAAHGMPPPVKRPNQTQQQTEVPPPALPGATTTYQPAERTAVDLSPTDALFDAINRGDIAAARDAINRGADLGGHNILGMTPLDLSVDLSRNNITFLLLSLRGGTTPPPRPVIAGTQPTAVKTAGVPPKPAQKLATAPARPAPGPAPVVQPVAVRQYAGPGDTGTAVPQAGFLGFGGTVR